METSRGRRPDECMLHTAGIDLFLSS
jgi:hypothetical protein